MELISLWVCSVRAGLTLMSILLALEPLLNPLQYILCYYDLVGFAHKLAHIFSIVFCCLTPPLLLGCYPFPMMHLHLIDTLAIPAFFKTLLIFSFIKLSLQINLR